MQKIRLKHNVMHSTQKNIYDLAPECNAENVCCRFLKYPIESTTRVDEGGLRLNNKFKTSYPDKPLVSIITSVFNNSPTLEQCILSVLNQTYDNIEYIIIDGASEDDGLDTIKKYKDAIDYYVSEPDNGIYSGMNKGLALASGQFILFLNSDDWYIENAVTLLVQKALESNAEIIAAHANTLDGNDNLININRSFWDTAIFLSCVVRHETMLVKKEVYNQLGPYDQNKKVIADWLWILKAFERNINVSILDHPILFFRSTGASEQEDPAHLEERANALSHTLGIDDKETLKLLMKPWILSQDETKQLIRKHPYNKKLHCALKPKRKINTKKVSVLVAVYNKELYLSECLDSILCQTLQDIEIICVDDGSTDASPDILKNYAQKDSRIQVITHNTNKGIIQARKTALIAANGDYISFIDADDLSDPQMCEALYNRAVSTDADFVQCNAMIYDPNNTLPSELFQSYDKGLRNGTDCTFKGKEIFRRFSWPIRPNLYISFYRKDVYKKVVPFIRNDAPRRGDDNLLTFFFMYFSRKYVFLDKVLYKYRANETSSNLKPIDFKLAKSQIEGRAAAIVYAKWFAQQNNIEWKSHKMPFLGFTNNIVRYAASFLERYVKDGGKKHQEMTYIFGDAFGGNALLYYMNTADLIIKPPGSNNGGSTCNDLRAELNAIYASRSWRLTKPLRWSVDKLRGILQ